MKNSSIFLLNFKSDILKYIILIAIGLYFFGYIFGLFIWNFLNHK